MKTRKKFADQLTKEVIDKKVEGKQWSGNGGNKKEVLTPKNKALEKIKLEQECAVPGCHYEIAREDYHHAVLEFIRDNFTPDEPMHKSIAHINPWTEDSEKLWMSVIKQNISLILISDTTGQIVAARTSSIGKKDKKLDTANLKPEGLRKIFECLDVLYNKCDLYQYYKVDEYVGFVALGVHKDYRRRGIGLKVQKAAVNIIKSFELGPIVVKGEGTSNFSKRIYEKLEFDVLVELMYDGPQRKR